MTDSTSGLDIDGGGAESMAATDFALDAPVTDLAGAARAAIGRIRGGELGSLPALLAIAVLATVFGAANPESFLSAINLANFLEQASSVIVIAMAVSFALLLGEIDLAAGFTAGVSAAVLATRLQEWPLIPSVAMAALVAIALGLFTGFMVARVGIPSFVVTLANVLLFQGILLLLVREGGSVRIEEPVVKDLVGANLTVALSWAFVAIGVLAYALLLMRQRRAADRPTPWSVLIVKVGALGLGAVLVTAILTANRAFPNAPEPIRGLPIVIPAVLVLVVLLNVLLNRTRFGRHLYAVGGNPEAARRAGIDVTRIRLAAFTLCGLLAGIGGAFLASRVNSVDPNTGANDTLLLAVGAAVIGGTSLFGGRGRMMNAVLGGFVLALIPNGLTLVGTRDIPLLGTVEFGSSGVKFICAGAALLLASSVDALSRRRTP
ncbi:MAG: LPXTG cell wall anchor domain-containing protein [Actinomycetota bacterium]